MNNRNVPAGGNLLAIAIAAVALAVAALGADDLPWAGQEQRPAASQAASSGSDDGAEEEGGEGQDGEGEGASGGEGEDEGEGEGEAEGAGGEGEGDEGEGDAADEGAAEGEETEADSTPSGIRITPAADALHAYPGNPATRITARGTRGNPQLHGAFWLPTHAPATAAAPTESAGAAAAAGAADPAPPAAPAVARSAAPMQLRLHGLTLVDTVHGRQLSAAAWDSLPTITVPRDGTPAPWTIQLRDVRAGRYDGYVLARPDSARYSAVLIPVSLAVKHGPWWAMLILFVGLSAVYLLRRYRDRDLDRDHAWMRLGRAQATIVEDPELANANGVARPFRQEFSSHLTLAATALQPRGSTGVAEAQDAMDKADNLWLAWNDGRENWIAGLTADQQTIAQLTPYAPDPGSDVPATRHPDTLLGEAKKAYNDAPTRALSGEAPLTSRAYRKESEVRKAAAVLYTSFTAVLDKEIAAATAATPPKPELVAALKAVRAEWNGLAPADAAAKVGELRDRVAQETGGAVTDDTGGGAEPERLQLDNGYVETDWGELIPRRFQRTVGAAHSRWFTYATVVTLMVAVVLALIGLKETWGDNPTFGADLLTDYLAVVTWALGINVASVLVGAAFFSEWRLPWLTSPDDGAAADTSGTTATSGNTNAAGNGGSGGNSGGNAGGGNGGGGNAGGGDAGGGDAGGGDAGGGDGGADADEGNAERGQLRWDSAPAGPARRTLPRNRRRLRRL
ncbi:hypothetical protein [Longimicrobium sp.]|jgi:hypothetical protein|uniref:hypothetical protein n=1 Tax=Longimicrobium sp. TaxID=2029185 RepID=UPI002F95218E